MYGVYLSNIHFDLVIFGLKIQLLQRREHELRSVILALAVLEERAVAAPRELLEPPAHVGVRLIDGKERGGRKVSRRSFGRKTIRR